MAVGPIRFNTRLLQTGKNTTGIPVPTAAIEQLAGGSRPKVTVQVNGYRYRTTVGVMGGKSMLPFSAEHRDASGLKGGDAIDVSLELDEAPRNAVVPSDLQRALEVAHVAEAFSRQAPSRKRADVKLVEDAKAESTRTRRIQAIVDRLLG